MEIDRRNVLKTNTGTSAPESGNLREKALEKSKTEMAEMLQDMSHS
jgi:hypothetical protein